MTKSTIIDELEGIKTNLDAVLADYRKNFGKFRDPVHLDLHLAASQNIIYRHLLTDTQGTPPIIRVVGSHYFAYDRTRLTTVMSPDPIIKQQFMTGNMPSERETIFLNHLVMITYRQIFRERRTLNGWLLRMSEADLLDGRGRFELLIVDKLDQEMLKEKETAVKLSQNLAAQLVPDSFLEIFKETIKPHWKEYCNCIGATERFAIAAELYAAVKTNLRIRSVLPGIETIEDVEEYRSGEDKVRIILAMPPKRPSLHDREHEIRNDIFRMLQSTVLYMRLYSELPSHFISLTTRADDFPYGLTIITAAALQNEDIDALHRVVEYVGKKQHAAIEKLFSSTNRSRLPEQIVSLNSTNLELKNYSGASDIWKQLTGKMKMPSHALAAFLRVIERATDLRVEHRPPKTAFVLSQSSYLESVGYVALEDLRPPEHLISYLELSDKAQDEALLESSRFYELDRWETGRGILPYDLVHKLQPAERSKGSLRGFLRSIIFQLDPATGFHLLDLDARFAYPQIGINCVRRLDAGIIGRFQEGAPLSPNGYETYTKLSREVNRFLAGVIYEGRAVLIFDGRIWAEYRDRSWIFYNHEHARAAFKKRVKKIDEKLLEAALDAAQLLSMNRHGAILALTNLSREEWEHGKGSDHFVPSGRSSDEMILNHWLDRDRDFVIRLAEADGCCAIGRNREFLDYRLMINTQDTPRNQRSQNTLNKTLHSMKTSGKGARHTNAALLSVASEWPVICISADGPATLLYKGDSEALFPSPDDKDYDRA